MINTMISFNKIINACYRFFYPFKDDTAFFAHLPSNAVSFITSVIESFPHRKFREKVRNELVAMFDSALLPYSDPDLRARRVQDLISELGTPRQFVKQIKRRKWLARPLWQRTAINIFDYVAIFMVVQITVIYISKPYRAVDYISLLNCLSLQDRDPDQNAKKFYDRAAALHTDMPGELNDSNSWPADLSVQDCAMFRSWLKDNSKALPLILQGTYQPYYAPLYVDAFAAREMTLETNLFYNLSDPKNDCYRELRQLELILSWSAVFAAYDSNTADALKYSAALMRFGRQLQNTVPLADQLVGLAAQHRSAETFLHLAADNNSNPAVLNEIAARLQNCPLKFAPIDMTVEKAVWLDFIQLCYSKYGIPTKYSTMFFFDRSLFSFSPCIFCPFLYTHSHANQDAEKYFARVDQMYRTEPFKIKDPNIPAPALVFELLAPAISKLHNIQWNWFITRQALDTSLAIIRFRNDFSRLPDDLNELRSKNYIGQIPIDPFSGSPIIYHKTQSDFLLYSVGYDRTDNNAARPDKKNKTLLSDIVFWPVK